MKKLLIKLYIVQVFQNRGRKESEYKGKGYFNAYRINPWNPLSYPTIIIFFIVGIIMFGVVGFWREVDTANPFKWN